MALDTVSHFFDAYRKGGKNGEQKLQSVRQNVSSSFKKSCLGKYSKYFEVPDDEFNNWLTALITGKKGMAPLTEDQKQEIKKQFSTCLKRIDESSLAALWEYWLRPALVPVSAFIVVDVQNDFITGSLALKSCPAGEDGEEVVPVIEDLFSRKLFNIVAYSLDWHPPNHCSFVDNVTLYPLHSSSPVTAEKAKLFDVVVYDKAPIIDQKLWPRHCEMNSWGSQLHKDLTPPSQNDITIRKGTNPTVDCYSAFWDNGDCSQSSLFVDLLKKGVTDLYICGLAFDVCVKHTAMDAVSQGFRTHVITDACRGVTPEGIAKTKEEFMKNGIVLLESKQVEDTIRDKKRK
ncbi:nicotinamidase-like [Montipora foliosa]|uniref:nicotinamidase-like n=1 Tax=Montipora foliosa TaxID=591990 RepID=UPI0035F0FD78